MLNDYYRLVQLGYTNDSHRGPGAVVKNLLKGLDELGVKVGTGYHLGALQGCLQAPSTLQTHYGPVFGKGAVAGPNLFVVPNESDYAKEICKAFTNFVVPSEWVKNLYLGFDEMKDKNIEVWPVGIDTEEWKPKENETKSLDCFIYYKNRTQQDLAVAYKLCKYYDLKFEIIEYGSYTEDQLKSLCERSKFAILLTGTESQGIAYMNILSMNVPCFVFDKQTWTHDTDKSINCPATSVPYFDKRCGEIAKDINMSLFEEFMHSVRKNHYKPREFILENYTLKQCADNYFSILTEADHRSDSENE